MGGYLAHSPVADVIRSGRREDVTVTASPLTNSSIECGLIWLQADEDNTDSIYWGGPDGQYNALVPGQTIPLTISNTTRVYVRSRSGTQAVNYAALD